jgi:hypothetical protein
MDTIRDALGASSRILHFLPERLYWEEFSSLHVVVYPHNDEFHTHYTPFECALLSIPCVMRAGTPFGVEYLERVLDPSLRVVCAFSDDELGVALHTIQSNPVISSEILRMQRAVAELRSPPMIAASAERITNVLAQFSCKQLERPDSDLTGLPVVEGTQELQRSVNGDHRKVEVQAASIATSPVLGLGIDAALVPSPSFGGLWRTQLSAGAEVWLRLGQPASLLSPVYPLTKVVVSLEWFDQCPEGLHLVVHDGENRFVCRSEMEIREVGGASFAAVVVRELGADHSVNLEVRAGHDQKEVVLGQVTLEVSRF